MNSRRKQDSDEEAPAEDRLEASALRLLARRSHTRTELRRKLVQRGFATERITALLDRFSKIGYLNDEVAARSWVRHRLDVRPMGVRLMASELARRGVSRRIQEVVLEAYRGDGEQELAMRAARKRMAVFSDDGRARERLLRFLRSRGFPSRVCLEVAGSLCPSRSEENVAHGGESHDPDLDPFDEGAC